MDYNNRTFDQETIIVSGNSFTNCKFNNCELVFNGYPVQFASCTFTAPQITFDGLAANTMLFLTGMYQAGGQEMIEGFFEQIRKGQMQPDWPQTINPE